MWYWGDEQEQLEELFRLQEEKLAMSSVEAPTGVSFTSGAARPPTFSLREVTWVLWQEKKELKKKAAHFMDGKDLARGWVMQDWATGEVEEFDCYCSYEYFCKD